MDQSVACIKDRERECVYEYVFILCKHFRLPESILLLYNIFFFVAVAACDIDIVVAK